MNTVPSIIKSLCLILALASVSLPVVSLAGDTDPNGVKLMLLHDTPKFKADLKEKTGDASNTAWGTVCALEVITVVGLGIWEARRTQDKCFTFSHNTAPEYCLWYSESCPHYSWDSNCLLAKFGKDYCSKP
jgi:hypothetical protein